jgi:hypothetical protein
MWDQTIARTARIVRLIASLKLTTRELNQHTGDITATNDGKCEDEFCVVDTLMELTLSCTWITVDNDTAS